MGLSSLPLATIAPAVGMVAGLMTIAYYGYQFLKAIKTLGPAESLAAKLCSLWEQDKPYVVTLGTLGYSAALALHYPIPEWVTPLALGLGIATIHASTKGQSKP